MIKGKTSLILKFGVVFLLILGAFFFSDHLKNAFFFASSPVQKLVFDKGGVLYGSMEVVLNLGDIKEEIRELRLENSTLSARLALQRDIVAENKALREALDLDIRGEEEFIFSEIISASTSSGYVNIKHGKNKEVKEGYSVITPEGAVLGSVAEVHPHFSQVMLLTSKETSFEARVGEYIGVLRGGEELHLEMLPRDSEIKEGDLVTTFSQSEVHPRGLFVGRVSEVIDDDVEAFVEAKVRPGFHLHEVDFLFILKR